MLAALSIPFRSPFSDQVRLTVDSTQRIGRKREKPTAAKYDELNIIPNRVDRTSIELFLVGILGWEAALRGILSRQFRSGPP